MSRTKISRRGKAFDKAMAHYKAKKSRRNWKRLKRAVARWADM